MTTDLITLLTEKVSAIVLNGETTQLSEKKQALASFYPVLLSILKSKPELINTLQNQLNPRFSDLFRTGTDFKLQFLSQIGGDLPLNETENLLSKSISPTIGLLENEAGSSDPVDIVNLIQSQAGSISSKLPEWAVSILSAFGLVGGAASASAAVTPQIVEAPVPKVVTTAPPEKEEKKSGFLLPLIALLILLALLAFFFKSCTAKKDAAVVEQSQVSGSEAAVFKLSTDANGQLNTCQLSSSNAGFMESIQKEIKTLFSHATGCGVENNPSFAGEFVDQNAMSGVIKLLKGVPGVNLNWTGDQLSIDATNAADAEQLAAKIKPLLSNVKVVTGQPHDENSAVNSSISNAEKAIAAINPEGANAENLANALNLQIINFRTGSNEIPEENKSVLNQAAELMKKMTQVHLVVKGHTDATGNPEKNKALSLKRAQSVVDYLTAQGVAPAQLKAVGVGQEEPIAENETPEGRFKNRRIEFEVVNADGAITTANTAQQH